MIVELATDFFDLEVWDLGFGGTGSRLLYAGHGLYRAVGAFLSYAPRRFYSRKRRTTAIFGRIHYVRFTFVSSSLNDRLVVRKVSM